MPAGILDYIKAQLMGQPVYPNMPGGGGQAAPVPGAGIGPMQPQVQAQAPSTPIMAPGVTSPQAAQGNDTSRNKWMEVLLRAGVPLGAAIAGTVEPGIADAAAGLSTGYNKGVEYGDELSAKRKKTLEDMEDDDVAIIDPDDPENHQIIKIPHGAKVMRKGNKPLTSADFHIGADGVASIGGQPLDGPKGDAASQVQERIKVINKEGQSFTVPAHQLEDARKQGYRTAE